MVPASSLTEVVDKLYDIEAVKFGEFTLKSGLVSPVYFDLRAIVSFPELMRAVSELIFAACSDLQFDCVCGVPYTALPIATCIAVDHNIPMLLRRKEAKDYGTRRILEGKYARGQSCLIIEDVVTSGSSVLETAEVLRREGLRVAGVGVLLDREQGAAENLRRAGQLQLRPVLRLGQLLRQLEASKAVPNSVCVSVRTFVLENQVTLQRTDDGGATATGDGAAAEAAAAAAAASAAPSMSARCRTAFERRAEAATQPQARRLLALMAEKETNLCVAADRTLARDVLALAEQVGPHICVLKTHCDIMDDFGPDFVARLRDLAKRHNFLVMEDRKLADIGHVARLQATAGLYRIADWADLVTAHALPGPGLLDALEAAGRGMACVLVAEMSSAGSPAGEDYAAAALAMAGTHAGAVAGLVCQSDLATDVGLVQFTPGVSFSGGASDSLGQRYREPRHVVARRGCDVIIVGRGISEAADPRSAAESYRQAAFKAYRERLKAES